MPVTVVRRSMVLLLLAGVTGAAAVPAEAVLPGTNGRIVLTSGRGGPPNNDSASRLFLLPVSSSPAGWIVSPPVVPAGGQYRHPTWSPDRTRIAFANGTPGPAATENFDIFIKDLRTDQITPITNTGDGLSADRPAWSPDGTRIAYEHQPVDNSAERDIRVQSANDLNPPFSPVNLTSGAPIESKPAWSPDSQTLFYGSGDPNVNANIVREAADNSGAPALAVPDSGISEFQPSISPDGARICFTLGTGFNATAEVFVAPLGSPSTQVNLSDDPAAGDYNCTWSPEGFEVAWVNGTFTTGALVMKNADDSGLRTTLTDEPAHFDGNPDWAPDGRPTCEDRTVTTPANTPVTIPLDCTDSGPTYEHSAVREGIAGGGSPANGTISFPSPPGDPTNIVYTPNAGFSGTDALQYIGFDDFGFGSDRGTITVRVAMDPGPPNGGTSLPPVRFPAKLEIARAGIVGASRRLDVLAPITARASGRVRVSFQAAGRTTRFTAPVDAENARVRFSQPIPAAQARRGTGIITITYPGDADTQPQVVRLRAASRSAALAPGRPTLENNRLRASGRVSRAVRGVVRIQLLFDPAGQTTRTLSFSARVAGGRYRLDEVLAPELVDQIAGRRGVLHSYTLFTGYLPTRTRGEMASFEVLGER